MEENNYVGKRCGKNEKIFRRKKTKGGFLKEEKKIGSGSVEKRNKNLDNGGIRTKKISQ